MNISDQTKRGFTIVELLVVIVVIGILATIIIVAYSGIQERAIIATIQSDLKNSATKLEMYKQTDDVYPANTTIANLKNSQNIDYDIYNHTDNSYCLQASKNNIIYHITSEKQIPTYGLCISQTFTMSWDAASSGYASAIIQTTDGGYASTGVTTSNGDDMYIAKYSSTGARQWKKTWGRSGSDWGRSIIQNSDGDYVVTGETCLNNDCDTFLVKYDSDGDTYWERIAANPANSEYSYNIIQDSSGNYITTGKRTAGDDYHMHISKFDGDGEWVESSVLWAGANNYGNSVIQTNDGGYAVAGVFEDGDNFNALIAKYESTINNDEEWWEHYGGPANEYAEYLVQTDDNDIIVTGTGHSYDAENVDTFIYNFNLTGDRTWYKSLNGEGSNWVRSMIHTSDDSVLLAGMSYHEDGGSAYDMFLYKMNTNGVSQWNPGVSEIKSFGYTNGTNEYCYNLTLTSDGKYTMVGETDADGIINHDLFMAKFNTDGSFSSSDIMSL